MKETQNYIKETMGLEVVIKAIKSGQQKNVPLFIKQLYDVYQAGLLGKDIILLKNKNKETATVDNLRKHAQLIEHTLNYPAVFVLPFLQAYNRKRLIQKQVAFIVPGKQMFIPQLFIDLRDYRAAVPTKNKQLLPAAQCLLFFHLLKENLEWLPLKTIAGKLNYTQATVTRAVQALAEKEIAQKILKNKQVQIQFKGRAYDLWDKALPVLQNPVKKVYFLDQMQKKDFFYEASFTALGHYTNLEGSNKRYYAVSGKDFQRLKKDNKNQIVEGDAGEITIQVWKYNPGILAKKGIVDPLSLYLTLKDEQDERVEMELEKMIKRLW